MLLLSSGTTTSTKSTKSKKVAVEEKKKVAVEEKKKVVPESKADTLKKAIEKNIPIFGICLGHQLLALAAGADTFKMKYGHRAQNQPCQEVGTKKCFITSQNHGFAVDETKLPEAWKPWFRNANDNTNEGIIHENGLFAGAQFHPEGQAGPEDTGFIFDMFVKALEKKEEVGNDKNF